MDIALQAAIGEQLRARATEIGRACVDRQYAATPEVLTKFGEAGYRKSVSDAEHNVSFLAESIALGDPMVFRRYIEWLRGVLAAAGVPAPVLPAHLELLAEVATELVPEHGDIVRQYVRAALQP
jgi:hypothetical protein